MNTYMLKRKIVELQGYKSNGTTLISIAMRPNEKVSDVVSKLTSEFSSSSCIKQSTTRNAVQSAITSAKDYFK